MGFVTAIGLRTGLLAILVLPGISWGGRASAAPDPGTVQPSGVSQISAGNSHTCAVTLGGAAKCWGSNARGQVGDGTTTARSAPVPVTGLTSGTVAATGGFSHSCALTAAGSVSCWGGNSSRELGDGTQADRLTPVGVSGLGSGVAEISAGNNHSCARTTEGSVWCWGLNSGRLGNGTTSAQVAPVEVAGLSTGVTAVSAGGNHSCALTTAGAVLCWGLGANGQLGNGTTATATAPVAVATLTSGVVAVAAGGSHTCALNTDGGVVCWGANAKGQLGDGTTVQRSAPVTVSGLSSGVTAITAGSFHTCARLSSGVVKCWGSNSSGQLGDGSTEDRTVPVPVSGLASDVTTVAAGGNHTCALKTNARVMCWGANGSGQLGDGTTTMRKTPVDVVDLTDPEPQTITFPSPPKNLRYGAPIQPLQATASSGLAVTYTPTGSCVMDGANAVRFTGVGMCTIRADQAGDTAFEPAPPQTRTIVVNPALTTTRLTVKPGRITSGTTATLTAVVTRQNAAAVGTITGRMTFKIGGKKVASTNLSAKSGKVQARIKVTGKQGSKVKIQATYLGEGNFAGSASPVATIAIT